MATTSALPRRALQRAACATVAVDIREVGNDGHAQLIAQLYELSPQNPQDLLQSLDS